MRLHLDNSGTSWGGSEWAGSVDNSTKEESSRAEFYIMSPCPCSYVLFEVFYMTSVTLSDVMREWWGGLGPDQ